MTEIALLNCKTEAGLFPDELTVVVVTKNLGDLSFFCPKEFIDDNKLRVSVLERSMVESLIKLPAESPMGSVVVVDNSALFSQQLSHK
jgi:hypothetical protein